MASTRSRNKRARQVWRQVLKPDARFKPVSSAPEVDKGARGAQAVKLRPE